MADVIASGKPVLQKDGAYIGEIRTFASDHAPDNWLECDGRSFKISEFPQLARVIGNLWGSKTKDELYLPDLRGAFLRGWNHGRTGPMSDPEAASRSLPVGAPGTAKDVVGSYQGDAVGPHSHQITAPNSWGDKYGGEAGWGYDNGKEGSSTRSTGAMDAKETRPRNSYVLFCIRAR